MNVISELAGDDECISPMRTPRSDSGCSFIAVMTGMIVVMAAFGVASAQGGISSRARETRTGTDRGVTQEGELAISGRFAGIAIGVSAARVSKGDAAVVKARFRAAGYAVRDSGADPRHHIVDEFTAEGPGSFTISVYSYATHLQAVAEAATFSGLERSSRGGVIAQAVGPDVYVGVVKAPAIVPLAVFEQMVAAGSVSTHPSTNKGCPKLGRTPICAK